MMSNSSGHHAVIIFMTLSCQTEPLIRKQVFTRRWLIHPCLPLQQAGSRLLHSPSLVAVGLSVWYEPLTWPALGLCKGAVKESKAGSLCLHGYPVLRGYTPDLHWGNPRDPDWGIPVSRSGNPSRGDTKTVKLGMPGIVEGFVGG